jgi:hypothetical protein
MILELLLLGGLAAAAGALATRGIRPVERKPSPRPVERTPWSVEPGDIVSYAGRDFVAERVLTYEEEGPRFREAILLGEGDGARLYARRGEVAFVRPAEPPEGAQSLPDRVVADDRPYRLLRRGNALVGGERWAYADYESPPGRLLLLRARAGGEVEAFLGEIISARGLLEILPGR